MAMKNVEVRVDGDRFETPVDTSRTIAALISEFLKILRLEGRAADYHLVLDGASSLDRPVLRIVHSEFTATGTEHVEEEIGSWSEPMTRHGGPMTEHQLFVSHSHENAVL